MSKNILFLLGDCPGNYVPLMFGLAKRLASSGKKIIVASTTPYYERYTSVDFSELGRVYYLSDYLKGEFSETDLAAVNLDYWNIYPTYVKDQFYIGRHRNNWQEYKKVALFYKNIFEQHCIDIVVSEPPSNAFLYLGFSAAKKAGADYLGFMSARIPSHVNVFLDAFGQQLLVNPSYRKMPIKDVLGPPDYMLKQNSKLIREGGVRQFRNLLRFSFSNSIETSSTPMHQLRAFYKKHIWRKARYTRVKMAGIFNDEPIDETKINVFYPLHVRPEASTSVLSRYYEDDFEVLKNIAFSLPNNALLVVKEHKPALGLRNLAFYRRVLSLPNTILINPELNFAKNVKRFDAVVTLTSTAGFEAIQAGVPVFLLGQTFYSDYPGVFSVESYAQLEGFLRNLKKISPVPEKNVMRRYLHTCFPGQFNYLDDRVLRKHNMEQLLVPIVQMLSE